MTADLRAANWLAQPVEEIQRWLAWKVLTNATFGLAVLTGTPEEHATVRALVVEEARTVLTLAGHGFADPAEELSYDPSEAGNPRDTPHQPSTWQSFARGTGSEVDFLNGEVVLLARLHGTTAPWNEALQRVLGRAAALGERPGVRSVQEVLALGRERSEHGGAVA